MAGGQKIVINDATSQYDRWLRALEPHYAEVDGRRFVDLLAFGVRFGALINFYNTEDRIDGDWVDFFLCNQTMLLASILAIDRSDIEQEFRQLRAEADELRRFDAKIGRLIEAFRLIHRTAWQANFWLRAARVEKATPWALDIRTRILAALDRGLAERLQEIEAASAAAQGSEGLGRAIDLPFEDFDPAWGVGEGEPADAFFEEDTPQARARSAWMRLEPAIRDLLYLIGDLQKIARAYLPETLKANNHQPQIGLYMAFCRLFKRAQDTLNSFSQRYVNFYYRDVLREVRAAAAGDQLYLTFALAASEGVFSAPVPAGTLFPAGENVDGLAILFTNDLGLTVTATLIESLHTLRVEEAPLWFDPQDAGSTAAHCHDDHPPRPPPPQPDQQPCVHVPARVIASDIVLAGGAPAGGSSNADVVQAAGFATFGQPLPLATSREVSRYAAFGFALSTQTLLLSGGKRSVTLNFAAKNSHAAPSLAERLKLIAAETGAEEMAVLATILDGAFDISVSTDTGWVAVESYSAGAMIGANISFTLSFKLDPEFPPVRLPDSEATTETEAVAGFVPQAPALKAMLRQRPVAIDGPKRSVLVYPFALLDTVDLSAIGVDVSVDPLPVSILRNTDGEIDPSSPYPFFGGTPEVGCYFEIQQTELFVKSVYKLEVTVGWFDLPKDEKGFAGYYQFYTIGADGKPLVPPISNDSFKADVSVKNPGWWRLESGKSPRIEEFVYRTATGEIGPDGNAICSSGEPAADGPLCGHTKFDNLTVKRIGAGPHYDPAASAIRIQLKAPPYGYGSSIYAQNVLNAVIADLPDAGLCEAKCQAACAVWTNLQTRIETALQECTGQGQAYLVCIWPKLAGVILRLLGAYELCKGNCAEPTTAAGLDAAVATLRGLAGRTVETLQADVRDTVIRLQQELDNHAGQQSASMQTCINFIRVALDIFVCLLEVTLAPGIQPEIELPKVLMPTLDEMTRYYAECLDICIAQCMQPKNELKYPNDPYLPQAETVEVGYRADVSAPAAAERPSDLALFHLTPFDGYEQVAVAGASLLPRFADAGSLYLGLSPFLRAQDLTLLFHMANARPGGIAGELPPVVWSYLSRNTWIALAAEQILSDGTNGLQGTGIVALRVPAIPATGTVLPAAQRWLRASVANSPDLFPQTDAVTPHALPARRFYDGAQGAPYSEPVPAGTITSAVQSLGDISTVAQPMPSFGGRPAQDDRAFEIGSGERLRHKDRAVLAWDYERLVLERFPSIWKAKALPAHNGSVGRVPGAVLVVVVPGPEFPQISDATVPSAPGEVLNQIAAYLRERASPFAAIRVDNPLYVRLTVEASVIFVTGQHPGDAIGRLNDELVQYLSPWFYDAERAARGARYWEEAEVAAFIQTRPYVAMLREIRLVPDRVAELENAGWCFMTSARSHDIIDAGWQEKRT